MDQDKVGNVVGGLEKHIAQPDVDPNADSNRTQNSFSRRVVGHGWKNDGHLMPLLFGAGGELDGETALIQTFANRQTEEEAALHGNGDDAIDSNRFSRNQANANTEFSFSQYKTGALHSQRSGQFPGEGMFTIGSTDGLWSGDTMLRVDPYADVVDMTQQAVGAVYGNVYKSESDNQNRGEQLGHNPFKAQRKTTKDKQNQDDEDAVANTDPAYTEMEEEEDGYDVDYYFDSEYHEGEKAEKTISDDYKTGLHRVNQKTSQGRQLAAVATKEQIMAAYSTANDQYAQVMKDHMGKASLNSEDRTDLLAKLRTDNSKYQASQMGVADVSRERSKMYHSKKNGNGGTTKLNTHLVGV